MKELVTNIQPRRTPERKVAQDEAGTPGMKGEPMIEITERAGAILVESLQASGVGPDQGMRLQEHDSGIALNLDTPTENDHVLKHQERTVLIVDRELGDKFGDTVIDVGEGPTGPKLTIRKQS
jgi:hypothetical protein